MRQIGNRIVYSPSDLVRFAGSAFASWMDRHALAHPGDVEADPEDETLAILAKRGVLHEADVLAALRDDGRDVAEISTRGDRFAATTAAIAARRDVIYQGALTDGVFTGYADFLVLDRETDQYEIWDSKLARSTKPSHVLQLCCYADLLEAMSGERVELLVTALGTGEHERLRLSDFRWYARNVRSAFLALMAEFDAGAPAPEPRPGDDHGDWTTHADAWFEGRDHLCRVAGIRTSQIERLEAAGITTLTALAESDVETVRGLSRDIAWRLHSQAALQAASRDLKRPKYTVLEPAPDRPRSGLALLPPASPMDVFLDLEGFPLADDGLEYLIGLVAAESGKPVFHDWWAHDDAQERAAF